MNKTDTQQQEQQALDELAAEVCEACEGERKLYDPIPNSIGCRTFLRDCPKCQDSNGKPTGRRYVGLSRKCHVEWIDRNAIPKFLIPENHPKECMQCQGSGRVPVSLPEAFMWLVERLIEKHDRLIMNCGSEHCIQRLTLTYSFWTLGKGSSLFLAVCNAIKEASRGNS